MVKMKKHNLSISSFRFIGLLFFSAVLLFALTGFGRLFTGYDEIQKRWDYFYALPENSLDILILGNSHAYSTYSPNILDAICETNSYVLASNSQKLEQTYFNLKEVLKYQKPKVVIIQSSVLSGDTWKNHEGDYRVYSNLDGMRFSPNKLKAIIEQRPSDDYANTLMTFLRNHENWKNTNLVSENLERMETPMGFDYRGFSQRKSQMSDAVMRKYDEASKTDYADFEINAVDLKYLKKIKEFSIEHNFKVIYVMSPKYADMINPMYAKKAKELKNVFQSFGHEYIDFNELKEQIGLEKRSFEDGFITYQHTSFFGAIQVSKYLAKHLNENYLTSKKTATDSYWENRLSGKKEYFLFGKERVKKNNAIYSMNKPFALFDSVLVENVHILKSEEDTYELIIKFDENLDVKKLYGFKFYVHLIPQKIDTNIREESKIHGFENFDFVPKFLPYKNNKIFTQRILNTKITEVEKLNFGLIKAGSPERSAKISIENISLN